MNNKIMFSSVKEEWETPQSFFDALNDEFHFDIDVCALPENAKCSKFYSPEDNAKCEKYYTREQDGLQQPWTGNVWCNPPYGRKIGEWVKKASKSNATVVMLLPARTDTKWFHEYIYGKAEIRFIKGRLKFGNSKNAAPFPSMVVIFRGD